MNGTTVVNLAGILQGIGLAVILIVLILEGAKIATKGSSGFASALGSFAGIAVGVIMVAKPNDVLNTLLKLTGGGIQPPTLPS